MKRSRRLIRKQRRRRKGWNTVRRLTFEPLETRQLLAVLMVNSIADTIDPQDGVVTLREAILAANTDEATELGDVGSGADEIRFDSTLFDNGLATIALSNLDHLLIYTDLAIIGPGANLLTIQAFDPTPNSTLDDGEPTNDGDGSRAFNINDGNANSEIAVSLKDLTISGGDTSGDGGGIRNKENLTISDSIIRDNIADRGGAIYSENGTLTVERSVLSGNFASRWGGAMYIEDSPLYLNDSSLTNNTAVTYGGGIDVVSSVLVVIDRSTISGNRLTSSTSSGGGIYARTSAGQITISNSTLSGNVGGVAGGIYASTDSGSITIVGSTISGNSAAGDGGGIYLQSNGAVLLAHSTITGNTANSDSDNGGSGGGIFHRGSGTLAIRNSIVAANIDNSGIAPDLDLLTDPPAIADIAFSLIGVDTGSSLTPGLPAANGNLIGTFISPINPLLAGLDNNGGPTQTHALLPGSPAINSGDFDALPGVNGVPFTDQRGSSRRSGLNIDMGAFEVFWSTPPNLTLPGPPFGSEGTLFDLSQFSLFTDDGSGPYSATVIWGDGSSPEDVSASGGTIFASHVYADDGNYSVQLQLSNPFGFDSESFLLLIGNSLPGLTVVGNQSITLGDPLNLTNLGSISDSGFDNQSLSSFETFSYFIDWDDGSIPDTGTATIDTPGSAIQPTLASFDGSHNYTAPGTYTVTVRVADDDMSGDFATGVAGVDYVERTFTVMVDGLPPVLTPPGPQSVSEAATVNLSQFNFFTDDGFSPYSAIVNWGDGSLPENVSASGGVISASHVYADDGIHTVQIQLSNAFGSDSDSFQVNVNNLIPNLTVVGTQSITEGETLNVNDLGIISDNGFANPPLGSTETFSYYIDWNDGSSPDTGTATIDTPGTAIQPTQASFNGSHLLANDGTFTVIVRVADDDMSGNFVGGVAGVDFVERTFLVMVAPVPLLLSNAPGDGTLMVTVGETGEFGSNADNGADDAFFDPVGVLQRLGAIYYSSVVIRADGLGISEFLPDAIQNPLVLEQSNDRIVSQFMVGPLRFVLTQELVPYFIGSEQVGSKLIQTYVIANTGTSELQFELLRYVDGDLRWAGGLNDGGGRQMVDFLETLFETDTVDSDNIDATFVGITAEGGVKPAQQRFEIDLFSALRDRILDGQGLRDAILGDVDGDQVIDNPAADIALAFNNLFVLASGATTQYVTTTIFGTGDVPITVVVPEEPRIVDPVTEPEFPGNEIPSVDPRAENVTLLILIGIPVPEEFPNLNGGSGGEISAPSLRSIASSIETAEAEQALQATLQRPHEVRREELIDAVFDLGEIELVGLLGVDMGDDPVLPGEKEEVTEKPKEVQKAKETNVVPGTTMLTPQLQQPKSEIAPAPVVAPIPDTGWQSMAFWLALAGTGTIWASGAWWWINRGRNRK